MIPLSGSAYTYGYATLGEFVAWIIGWDLILEYLFAAATVAVGWSGYVVSFLKDLGHHHSRRVHVRALRSRHARRMRIGGTSGNCSPDGWTSTGAVLNVPAMLIVARHHHSARHRHQGIGEFQQRHRRDETRGHPDVHRRRRRLHQPEQLASVRAAVRSARAHFGWRGVVRGAGVIFFAYIGFDAVSTAAQEAKNPQRDMPIGLLGSLGICTVLYIAVSLVLTGIVNYTQLNVPAPIAVAINSPRPVARLAACTVIKIGAIAGLSSVILVMLLGQPRIFYTMSKDGLLPPVFSAVHPKFRTPWIAQILTGAVAMLIAGLVSHRPAGRTGFHRHAARVCHCLRRRVRSALHRPGNQAPVPHAGLLADRAAGRYFLRLSDV